MLHLRLITTFIALFLCTAAFSQPRSISKIVGESEINEEDEKKIQKFAVAWAEELQTTDAETLKHAHNKLTSPFDDGVHMTPHGRSLYGKYLKEGFAPLLSDENENEMAAVNALQIYSLLGTEQGCAVLIKHAHAGTQKRDALRLWASIGLGSTFLVGELPQNRIDRYAKLLSSYIGNEGVWYVLARQFDALAALQSIPGLDRSQRVEMEELSFTLQTNALVKLLSSIPIDGADQRVQALPLVLPSLRMQLNEPGVDDELKSTVFDSTIPHLITFVENASTNPPVGDSAMMASYGRALHSAGLLISKGQGTGESVNIVELWNNGDYPAILALTETWKSKQ